MFETLSSLFTSNQSGTPNGAPETKRVLTMVKNERMGGYVPKWETVLADELAKEDTENSARTVETKLSDAAKNFDPSSDTPESDPGSPYATAYSPPDAMGDKEAPLHEPFGFGDLVDMVNPFHHIPLVGSVYREITGDHIKPIGNIIGGAAFGGPLGLIGGLVNAISTEETGKQIDEHAVAFFTGRGKDTAPPAGSTSADVMIAMQESIAANAALNRVDAEPLAPAQSTKAEPDKTPAPTTDLPGTVISVADLQNIMRNATPVSSEPKQNSLAPEYIALQKSAQMDIKDYPFKPRGSITDLFKTPDPFLMQAAEEMAKSKAKGKEDDASEKAARYATALGIYGVY